ncbi:hypothetical protein Tco_0293930 [Tanacetum coccineum]
MLDEYFTPPSIAVSLVQEAAPSRAVVLADSPVSTSIDHDALSSSTISTQEQEQFSSISQGFEESPKTLIFHDDPLNESPHEESTSQGSSSNVRQTHTSFEHLGRWTKDHPIVNIISNPSRSVSTRKLANHSSPRGIFLKQSKYASEIVKKYGMLTSDSIDTPMVEKSKVDEDLQGKPIDATLYRGMIRSLMYLTSSRPDLIYAVCLCARYQAKPTEKHLNAVKRIFRYIRGTINRGLWYSKDSAIALTAFADVDHACCQDTRRSTSGSM